MKLKIISILPIILFLFITITYNKGISEDSAFRSSVDISNIYIDDNTIALSDNSNIDTTLRTESLKVFNLVNEQREANGLSTLIWDNNLEQTSYVRALECSTSFSHTRPNGKSWYTVNSAIMGGENLAYGFFNANDVINAWMKSPSHKENILYPSFTKMSVSVYVSDDGTYYWAQEFGY